MQRGWVLQNISQFVGENERAFSVCGGKTGLPNSLTQSSAAAGFKCAAPAGSLFEMRFGYEVRLACPDSAIAYEFDAGVHGSTVDFLLTHGEMRWLIELVGLDESRTISSMLESSRTRSASGIVTETVLLHSEAEDARATPFAELIRVGEKLEEKVWDKATKRRRKFPAPKIGWGHVLVVNMNGFQGTGEPDGADCHELVFGSNAVRPEHRSDNSRMIVGLFDPRIPDREQSRFSRQSTSSPLS